MNSTSYDPHKKVDTQDDGLPLAMQTQEDREAQESAAAEIAAQYDVESRTRTTTWRPLSLLLTAFAVFVALYHMYTAYFGAPPTLIHRSIHVSAVLFLVFMLYPPFWRAQSKIWYIFDTVLAV